MQCASLSPERPLPHLHVPPQWGEDIQTTPQIRRVWGVVSVYLWTHFNPIHWSLLPARPQTGLSAPVHAHFSDGALLPSGGRL